MRSFVRIGIVSFFCLAAMPAAAAPPRAPTGKWVLEFAEDRCVAMRDYGAAKEPSFLAFKPSPTGTLMQIAVILKDDVSIDPDDAAVTVRIDALPPIQTRLLSFRGTEKGTRQISINLPMGVFAPMRRASSLSITSGKDIDESFALKQMPALMEVMDRCLNDLQQVWNVSPFAQAGLKSQAQASANLASYFSNDDYPLIAQIEKVGGIVEFMLLVNESGRVADCMVTGTSGIPALDAQACALLRNRARFTPATSADGKPAKDVHTGRVKWVIPDERKGVRID